MPEQTNGHPAAPVELAEAEPAAREVSLIDRERSLLRELSGQTSARAAAETQLSTTFTSRKAAADRDHQKALREAEGRMAADSEASKGEYQKQKQAALSRFGTAQATAEAALKELRGKATEQVEADKEKFANDNEEARWQANAVFEAAADDIRRKYEALDTRFKTDTQTLLPLQEEARYVHDEFAPFLGEDPSYHSSHEDDPDSGAEGEASSEVAPGEDAAAAADQPPPPPLDPSIAEGADPTLLLQQAIGDLDAHLYELKQVTLPKFLAWNQFFVVILGLAILLIPAIGFLAKNWPVGIAVGLAAAVGIGIALRKGLMAKAHSQVAQVRPVLAATLAETEALVARCPGWIAARRNGEMTEAEKKRDRSFRRADDTLRRTTLDSQLHADLEVQQAKDTFDKKSNDLKKVRDEAIKVADEAYARRAGEIKKRFQTDSDRVEATYGPRKAEESAKFQAETERMIGAWNHTLDHARQEIQTVQEEDRRLFLPWDQWAPAPSVPSGVRFGTLRVEPAQLPGGPPKDAKLRPTLEGFDIPALLPLYGQKGSLMLKAGDGAGKEAAVDVLHTTMLRLITALPPAKVRFTIIDPVGLGRNFAAFMHLADYDEQFVTSRIWTEQSQVEQRLVDLTEHMENVIQKYLRNEYETIEQYNAQAGEVAEPFRILVVANYPAGFNDNAVKRLASIIDSGVRCGVHTLLSLDPKQATAVGANVPELERQCLTLEWKNGAFAWTGDEAFSPYPLTLDRGPRPDAISKLMHIVGAKAKEAKRVEVPFEVIAPAADRWWSNDSRSGLDIPLGRAGASRLQHMKLGRGTSQHVLVAGKTGSGKSTLMHALIVNAALRYSPDELEFYLIDFKKGVEFKTYASWGLPHARVIAVESEREFGLSVLQRLDVELTLRGDNFRKVGAQDVASYRNSANHPRCPRILLIIDEFQEFFIEDDKLAQEASLLLDRLVRQGRAFGIHVHLGSQTLSGAYSLARSTLGQMAIRIALQCSEADSHLILSEDNGAARLLSRPGEAIYNDANGLVEGNHPFQVVWLADHRKEDYLKKLRALDISQGQETPRSQIVFEGSLPALPSNNPRLEGLLDASSWPSEPPKAASAWLGEAIAIKDPTSATFRPQGGSNLLLVGQEDEGATGILANAIIGLAAQHPADNARFVILDGLPVDSPLSGVLGRAVGAVPHSSRVTGARDAAPAIHEVADEVERRMAEAATADLPSIYLIIHDLQRFRELRKAEDDYSFGSSRGFGDDEPVQAPPSQRFAAILRDGPNVNVHTLAWSDSLTNVNRTIDRSSLREFELRVLFQMNANDSSALLDTPIANRLGPNRAYYNSESENVMEKFRPYQVPDAAYLDRVRTALDNRPAGAANVGA